MNVATIDPLACDRSPACPARRLCPASAFSRADQNGPWSVDWTVCTGCGACVRVCPVGAISMIPREER